MGLKEQIQKDLSLAMKKKDQQKVLVLRGVLSEILAKEKEKRYLFFKKNPGAEEEAAEKQSRLDNSEIESLIFSEVKKRKEAIADFSRAGRNDLQLKEKSQIEILNKYLPELLSAEEIELMAREVVKSVGASGIKDMGRVMSQMSEKTRGKADGSEVALIVKKILLP